MNITEVRIKLMEDQSERLQAFCSITLDDSFVIRDLKIIEGTNGPFVAMPSRKLTSHCGKCGSKNHLRAGFCNQCGTKLKDDRASRDADGRAKLYADIAHPINSACREMIQNRVIDEFESEVDRAQKPGYVSRYEDYDYEDDFDDHPEPRRAAPEKTQVQPAAQEPRPPHSKTPAPSRTERRPTERPQSNLQNSDSPDQSGNSDFGAGIF